MRYYEYIKSRHTVHDPAEELHVVVISPVHPVVLHVPLLHVIGDDACGCALNNDKSVF